MAKKSPPVHWSIWVCAAVVVVAVWLMLSPASAPPPHGYKPAAHVTVAPLAEQTSPVQPPEPPSAPAEEAPPPIPPASLPLAGEESRPLPVPIPAHGAPVTLPPGSHPRIAIIIDDVGLDLKDSKRAIGLPAAVTLSYMPYATRLRQQTAEAREAGHELMLHMPMEPLGHDDPGPGALLTDLPADEIRQRFDNALASFTGFDGVNNHMGSKFTADATGMGIVMDELAPRHLFFLDSRTNAKSVGESLARQRGVPTIPRDVFLDDEITLKGVNAQLAQTERVARRKGYAVAIGHPHPITLDVLNAWAVDVQARGFVLVPVGSLISQAP